MDHLLVNMWERQGTVNQLFVLYVLETLSEDVINKEDAMAGLRLDVLGDALNQIMVPPGVLKSTWNASNGNTELRCGQEGWFARMFDFLSICVEQLKAGRDRDKTMASCAVKAIQAIRPTIAWINLKATLVRSSWVEYLCVQYAYSPTACSPLCPSVGDKSSCTILNGSKIATSLPLQRNVNHMSRRRSHVNRTRRHLLIIPNDF